MTGNPCLDSGKGKVDLTGPHTRPSRRGQGRVWNCIPVPTRGCHKRGVGRVGRLGHAHGRRHDRKVRFGLVDLSRLEIQSAERVTRPAIDRRACVDDCFCCGNWLE